MDEGKDETKGIEPAGRTIRSMRARKMHFGLLAALAVVLFILVPQVFLLLFVCVLWAVLLSAICEFIERHSSLRRKWSLTITLTLLIGVAVMTGWLLGPEISRQFARFSEELPRAIANAREQISASPLGSRITENLKNLDQVLRRSGSGAWSRASTVLSSTLGVIVQLFVVFFVGLFLAGEPKLYRNGFARLFPQRKRKRIRDILLAIGTMLKRWLLGRLILMGANGIVTATGLWLMGIPLAVSLGLISALLNFIPNFGPWIAAAPAVLIALMESPDKAFQVALFYLAYQMFDGYVLTPIIQSRTATVPSAIVLMSQVLFGVLFGALGVLVAVPAAAMAMVLLREVHVKDVLGDDRQNQPQNIA